jgi:hypothetical protein
MSNQKWGVLDWNTIPVRYIRDLGKQSSAKVALAEANPAVRPVGLYLRNSGPKYLPRLPHDVITGGPLRYVKHGPDDYSVYAVGWDGKDDGGESDSKSSKVDWGWPNTISIPKFIL